MARSRKILCRSIAFLALAGASAFAQSSVIFLAFNSLGDQQAAANFYNGSGAPTTPNYGITFSSNFFGLVSECAFGSTPGDCEPGGTGTGAYIPNPTATSSIFIPGMTGAPVTGVMNVPSGFTTGFNFFYTAAFPETVTVWSGANGTGTALATTTVSNNDAGCTSPAYCQWAQIGMTFSGTAQSVTFAGPANGIGLSDFTIGSNVTFLRGSMQGGCCFNVLVRGKRNVTQQQNNLPAQPMMPSLPEMRR